MKFTEVTFDGQPPVDAYGPGFFRVENQPRDGALLLSAKGITGWGGLEDPAPLLALADSYDILFVGTGADIAPLPATLRETLEEAGVAAEVMSSPSACRTYNILLSEGRRVAIAALPV
ncbi:Mth938-like domain-containing protein [Neptunicoccus cionae]|uniref:Mth938-like domain-containing protein n=1 Tax=Neptunicoccus cionae TaxID=2035344 RepID=UPI000C761668|nr:Mth938-like domain-containing protein [Amylibacter cionae]PLS22051.1 hypothetical protein C0U40_06335 [Amylibacter cionae]